MGETKYTLREMVLAQREASAKARCAALWQARRGTGTGSHHQGHAFPPCFECSKKAAERYPLPKVTRPRTVTDPHDPKASWRWYPSLGRFGVASPTIGDADYYTPDGSPWSVTRERVAIWADLIANPTEEAENE